LLPVASQTLAKVTDMVKRVSKVLPVFPDRKYKLEVGKNGVETRQNVKILQISLCVLPLNTGTYTFCQLYCGLHLIK